MRLLVDAELYVAGACEAIHNLQLPRRLTQAFADVPVQARTKAIGAVSQFGHRGLLGRADLGA